MIAYEKLEVALARWNERRRNAAEMERLEHEVSPAASERAPGTPVSRNQPTRPADPRGQTYATPEPPSDRAARDPWATGTRAASGSTTDEVPAVDEPEQA